MICNRFKKTKAGGGSRIRVLSFCFIFRAPPPSASKQNVPKESCCHKFLPRLRSKLQKSGSYPWGRRENSPKDTELKAHLSPLKVLCFPIILFFPTPAPFLIKTVYGPLTLHTFLSHIFLYFYFLRSYGDSKKQNKTCLFSG